MTVVWRLQPGTAARWDTAHVGGKAASVARLCGIPDTRVPHSAVLPVDALRAWLERAIPPAQRGALARSWAAGEDAPEVRRRVENAGVPRPWMTALRAYFRHRTVLMVRSSAVMEDGADSSYAGHFESQATTLDALEQAILHCAWEGVRAAFVYATPSRWPPQRRLQHAFGVLALLIQAASPSEAAGVCFTRSPLHADAMMVTAAFGSCHGVVDGTLPTDTYVVFEERSEAEVAYKEHMTVLCARANTLWPGETVETPLGPSTFLQPYGPFLALAAVPKALAGYPALGDDQLSDVCVAAGAVATRLGHAVDLEWCLDEGDLTLLQARPVTAVADAPLQQRARDAHGRPASPGVASGPARVLRDVTQVERAQKGDVLLVTATDPAWLPAFYKAAAVVSEEGSPLSHTAIVARELGIPCLVGVDGATRGRFLDGERLRVDANVGLVLREKRGSARGGTPQSHVATEDHGARLCVDLRQFHRAGVEAVTVSALLDAWLQKEPHGEGRVADVVALWRRTVGRRRVRLVWDLAPDAWPQDRFLLELRAALPVERG